MDWPSWDQAFRILNASGCLFALYILAKASRNQWRGWNFKTQNHWWALFGWVALGCEGAIESYILDVTPGPRIILQSLVVAWTIRALTTSGKIEAEAEIPWKKEDDL